MENNISLYERQMNNLEKLHTLEVVSGLSIDQLISLFMAGYTLKGPEPKRF